MYKGNRGLFPGNFVKVLPQSEPDPVEPAAGTSQTKAPEQTKPPTSRTPVITITPASPPNEDEKPKDVLPANDSSVQQN